MIMERISGTKEKAVKRWIFLPTDIIPLA
jgi:hypothetical protein